MRQNKNQFTGNRQFTRKLLSKKVVYVFTAIVLVLGSANSCYMQCIKYMVKAVMSQQNFIGENFLCAK